MYLDYLLKRTWNWNAHASYQWRINPQPLFAIPSEKTWTIFLLQPSPNHSGYPQQNTHIKPEPQSIDTNQHHTLSTSNETGMIHFKVIQASLRFSPYELNRKISMSKGLHWWSLGTLDEMLFTFRGATPYQKPWVHNYKKCLPRNMVIILDNPHKPNCHIEGCSWQWDQTNDSAKKCPMNWLHGVTI